MNFTEIVGIIMAAWFLVWIVSCGVVHAVTLKSERKRAAEQRALKRWRAQNFRNIIRETRDI